MTHTDDQLVRDLARLKSLRMRLPQTLVPEEYVVQYHGVLDSLRAQGYDIKDWMIPEHWMSTISNSGSKKRYVAQGLLLMRLDAVLALLITTTENSEEPRVSRGGA